MRHRLPLRRFALLVGAVLIAISGSLGLEGVSTAQSVDDLRERARSISDELDRLSEEGDRLEQEYLETGERMSAVETEIAANQRLVEESQVRMEEADRQAGAFLVSAFMDAGTTSRVALGANDPNKALNQRVLLDTLGGDRTQVADALRAAKLDLRDRTDDLARLRTTLEKDRRKQELIKAKVDSSVARQRNLLDSATAQLNQAIQVEQARRQAESEARARAAIEAAAQQAAAQQAMAIQGRAIQSAGQQRVQGPPRPAASAGSGQLSSRAASGPAAAPAALAPVVQAPGNPAAYGAALSFALSKVGTPYLWGGTGNGGYDCSGLSMTAFAAAGKKLPRTAAQQYAATQRVSSPQPGDLIFYGGANASHMGIYLGDGKMVAAPRTGDVVKVQPVYGTPTYGRVG